MRALRHDGRWSRCAVVLGAASWRSRPPARWRHHSFAAYYIEADTIEVEGDVVEFQYKNPHSWIHVIGQESLRPAEDSTPPNGPARPGSSATASPRTPCTWATSSASGRPRTATRTTTASASSESSAGRTAGSGEREEGTLDRLEVELGAELEQPALQDLQRPLPGGAVRVVQREHRVRVEQVVEVERCPGRGPSRRS